MKRGSPMENKTRANKLYDLMKFLITIFAPALIVLITGLGGLLEWENTDLITGVIALFMTFFASLLQISSTKYHSNKGE